MNAGECACLPDALDACEAKYTAIVAMEYEQETIPKLSSITIFNDLELPLGGLLRSCQNLTLNMSVMVKDRHIPYLDQQGITSNTLQTPYSLTKFQLTLNDLE